MTTREPRGVLRRRNLAFAALLVLAFGFQGTRGLYAPDEGYYAGVAHEMVDTGDYLIPRLASRPWIDKPPLSLWGIAAGMRLVGNDEWGARAFNALCYVLTTLLVCALGEAMENRGLAIGAGVVYATMLLPFAAANVVTPDTPLTLFTTFAFYCFWKSLAQGCRRGVLWKTLLLGSLGLAFLTKGPAALLPAGAMFGYLLLRGETRRYVRIREAIPGMVLFTMVGLGWYAFVALTLPGALQYFWRSEVVGRIVSSELDRNAGAAGAAIYLPVLLIGAMPWCAAWGPALWRMRHRLAPAALWRDLRRRPARLLLASWIGIPMVILGFASSRLPLYTLPIFPALALVTAMCIASVPSLRSAPARNGALAMWVAGLVALKLGAALAPSELDLRALNRSIQPHLPADGRYELVAVDQPLEGLSFYASADLERVSDRLRPYPFFAATESLEVEIREMQADDQVHVFIVKREGRALRLERQLEAMGAGVRHVKLDSGFHLVICERLNRGAGPPPPRRAWPAGPEATRPVGKLRGARAPTPGT